MSELSRLLERIDGLCRQVAAACSAAGLTRRDVEDLLTEGYLAALTGESHSHGLAVRLSALVESLENEEAAIEARKLAIEKRTVDQRVSVLRLHLANLREHLVQLPG